LFDLLQNALTCQALASAFNQLVQTFVMEFSYPVIAVLDKVSDFTTLARLFKPHEKRLRRGEAVVVENFIQARNIINNVFVCLFVCFFFFFFFFLATMSLIAHTPNADC
jgi:large-conductance mechanosensitive channel